MSSIESVYENSEPRDGLSDLGSTDASGSSGPNKRKRQHCAPDSVGRRRDTMLHPVAQCEWSTDHTLRLLSKKIEALLIENSNLREKLRANGLCVDNTSQSSYEVTRLESSEKLWCKPCKTQFLRVSGLLRHIRKSHPELVPYVDQKNCVQCDLIFERPSDLVRHEKFHHEESYTIRIELFGELERFDELIKEESSSWSTFFSSSTSAAQESVSSCSQHEDEHQKTIITIDTHTKYPIAAVYTGQANLGCLNLSTEAASCSSNVPSENFHNPDDRPLVGKVSYLEDTTDLQNLDIPFPADRIPHPEGLNLSTEAASYSPNVPSENLHSLGDRHRPSKSGHSFFSRQSRVLQR